VGKLRYFQSIKSKNYLLWYVLNTLTTRHTFNTFNTATLKLDRKNASPHMTMAKVATKLKKKKQNFIHQEVVMSSLMYVQLTYVSTDLNHFLTLITLDHHGALL
jgi:hypothetical protein